MDIKTEIDEFILLSEILTDRKDLNKKIAEEYLARLQQQLPESMQKLFVEMDKITSTVAKEYWEFEFKRKIIENDKKFVESDCNNPIENNSFAAICQQILRLWYTSQFNVRDDKTDVRTREQYNFGLLWKVVHTEAPGADKRQTYGYWRKNPIVETNEQAS